MVTAVVGAGGKTTLIHALAARYRAQGRSVFVTTSTHMYAEADTLTTGDADLLLTQLRKKGYVMAGLPELAAVGKIRALPPQVYAAVCACADETLVEADGSRQKPVKFPAPWEPVIPANTQQVVVVCNLCALGKPLRQVAHHPERVAQALGISQDTPLQARHIQALLRKGYLEPLKKERPDVMVRIHANHDGTPARQALAALLESDRDVGEF